ncbi:hypothetical protein T4A_14445, partial [Trichinella pseudospiralis]
YRKWRREETKNADETVQKFIDGTKQIKRNQEAYLSILLLDKASRKDEVKTRTARSRSRTTRSRSRTTRSRTVDEDIRYMWFPKGPNSVSLG